MELDMEMYVEEFIEILREHKIHTLYRKEPKLRSAKKGSFRDRIMSIDMEESLCGGQFWLDIANGDFSAIDRSEVAKKHIYMYNRFTNSITLTIGDTVWINDVPYVVRVANNGNATVYNTGTNEEISLRLPKMERNLINLL